MKRRNLVRWGGILICLGIIGFSGWKLYGILTEYSAGEQNYQNMIESYQIKTEVGTNGDDPEKQEERPLLSVDRKDREQVPVIDFEALKRDCPDVVGWLYCADTPINYPVVQSEDNAYYLHRLPDGTDNQGGTLFVDFRNAADFSDWNTIIYGHNMKNGSMFGALPEYLEPDFYREHPRMYLLTDTCDYQMELIGGYVTPADSDTHTFPANETERDALAKRAAESSSFDSDVVVEQNDRLVTLSTCVYDYENARYVLVGVLRGMDGLAE